MAGMIEPEAERSNLKDCEPEADKKININFRHFSGLFGLGLEKIWDRLLEKISLTQAALS